MTILQLRSFFRDARTYLNDPRFLTAEVDYKVSLQAELRPVMQSYQDEARNALTHLINALHSPNQNIINWRVSEPFVRWCKSSPGKSSAALRHLWFGKGKVSNRFDRFTKELAAGGITQRGAQLCITSTLLMGVSASEHPPVRTAAFRAAFLQTGYRSFEPKQTAVDCYLHALGFLDYLISEAPRHSLTLRDRLETQGVLWCVTGGWKGTGPGHEVAIDAINDAETLNRIENEPDGKTLSETEKHALVLSRRGQGQFRLALIGIWGKCAITECRDMRLLRASHLKPWKASSNGERLDPFNGVLLAAHFDAALDCGLITFADSGRIVCSPRLASVDRNALSISTKMQLPFVDSRHLPYLRFHRENTFKS